jgi:hypothetical protein
VPPFSGFAASIGRVHLDLSRKFIPLSASGHWNANLKPGFYFLSSSLTRRKANGDQVTHAGIFAIVVTSTRPLGTVPAPRC